MKFGAVILDGGKSRRMGRDKAELMIAGKTFLEHIAGELGDFEELMISVNSTEKYPHTKYKIVTDIYTDCGPMSGIHAALSVCDSDVLLVVSCDLPLFRSELGIYLREQLSADLDAVVPVTSDGRIHPLCAVYHKRTVPIFKKYLDAGNYKILEAFKSMRVKFIPLDRTPCSEKWLQNVNTPEEYEALCAQKERIL
ncbi:MAG: molybdenum cofactor guanylyltransferase [Oscillospiraceae bacterium]|nr:molybdenum cofactor guanylyltransferase [Oscillospiraceae bacterium]